MSVSSRITIEPVTEPPVRPKRRQYSIAEKRRIVEESFQPTTSVARVAREHGVNANQVFSWRRLYRCERLGGAVAAAPRTELLPVTISDLPLAPTAGGRTPAASPVSLPTGTIQLQLPRGRLRVEGAVDAESLRLVLQCMLA
jgi:transposase